MFYQGHLFICCNKKEDGKVCCADKNPDAVFHYAKQRLTELGLYGPGKIRVTRSGCLGRCATGPSMVFYPENIWYRCMTEADVERVIQSHIINGVPVRDLLMDQPQSVE